MGVTINSLSQYLKRKVTKEEIRDLTTDLAKRFYHYEFWEPMKLDEINDLRIQLVLFDQAVNRGIGPAIKDMNKAITGQPDAILDRNKMNRVDPLLTVVRYLCNAQDSYLAIVLKNPTQIVFLKGWLARTHELLNLVVSLEEMTDLGIQ